MFYCEGCENDEQFKNEEAKKQQQQEQEQEQQPVVDEATDTPEDEATDEQLTKSQKQPTVEQQTNNSISIQKQPPSLRDADNNNNNKAKYSMSLPREIPDMLFKYAKKKSTDNPKQTGALAAAAESTVRKQTAPAPDPTLSVSFQNVTNASLIEELKRDMATAANNQQTSAVDSLNRQSGDENRSSSLADEEADKFNEENNIGEAISYLASSIIAKDGRELFGYRPSRRVQVNCISQSYF